MLAQSCRNQPESGPEKVFVTPEFDRSVTAVNPPELIGHWGRDPVSTPRSGILKIPPLEQHLFWEGACLALRLAF